MPKARLFVLLLVSGCGSAGPSAEPGAGASAHDAAAETSVASGAVFQEIFPRVPPSDAGETSTSQCLDGPLPVGDSGVPNCVVVSASLQTKGAEGWGCVPCDAPGLEPLATSVSLASIGESLSNYPCLCAVKPQPSANCGSDDTTNAWWCYSDRSPAYTHLHVNTCAPRPGPAITFSPPVLESGTIYVACFAM